MPDQLTEATTALNRAALAYEDHVANLRLEVDAAMADLKGVVRTEMLFVATIDVDAVENDIPNRLFNNLPDLIAETSPGAYVVIACKSGQVIPVEQVIVIHSQTLRFIRDDAGAVPIIRFRSYEAGGENLIHRIATRGPCSVIFDAVNVETEAKQNAALDWALSERCCIRSRHGEGNIHVAMMSATFAGAAETALTQARVGAVIALTLHGVTLSGACLGVNFGNLGIINYAVSGVTLTGGAALQSAGVLGTNYLEG